LTVSVVMPAFNAAPWIEAAIRSVQAQSHRDWEVIVVDDGSTDATAQIARACSDHRVRVVTQATRGAAAARNRGIREARGDVFQFLDADDALAPNKLESQLRALRGAPGPSVASCPWTFFVHLEQPAAVRPEPVWELREPLEWLTESLSGGGMMQTGAWLVPRQIVEAVGPWNEALSLHDDGEFFTRVLLGSAANLFVPDTLVYYRRVPGSLSQRRGRSAIESSFAVCRLRSQHLLARRDDRRVRRAIATQFAQFVYEFQAAAPDLAYQGQAAIRTLGVAPAPVIGGRAFRLISAVAGFSVALRLRALTKSSET
jgi:glycosyltransferase involved in cell wall biosynthesis